MEDQLHPNLVTEALPSQSQKNFSIHPGLQAEMEPEVEQQEHVEEQIQAQPEEPEAIVEASEPERPANDAKSRQWRELRAQADEAKQMKREAEAMARERDFYREQALKQQKPQEVEEDYRTDTEKSLYREMQELKQQVARHAKDTEAAKRQASIASAETRLLQDYPDIKEIVTNENIQLLEQTYPNLYNAVIASSDVYSVGSTAYELIIAKGIAQKSSKNLPSYAQNTNPNRNKPRSASTVAPQAGETPIQRAGSFMGNSESTDDERKALYQEMINSSRNRAF